MKRIIIGIFIAAFLSMPVAVLAGPDNHNPYGHHHNPYHHHSHHYRGWNFYGPPAAGILFGVADIIRAANPPAVYVDPVPVGGVSGPYCPSSTRVWVPPVTTRVWRPGHYTPYGGWVPGFWTKRTLQPGYWASAPIQ